MKTIEERANEYANSWGIERPKIFSVFVRGARSEHEG